MNKRNIRGLSYRMMTARNSDTSGFVRPENYFFLNMRASVWIRFYAYQNFYILVGKYVYSKIMVVAFVYVFLTITTNDKNHCTMIIIWCRHIL